MSIAAGPTIVKALFQAGGLSDNEPSSLTLGLLSTLSPVLLLHTHILSRGRRSGRQSQTACLEVGEKKQRSVQKEEGTGG